MDLLIQGATVYVWLNVIVAVFAVPFAAYLIWKIWRRL